MKKLLALFELLVVTGMVEATFYSKEDKICNPSGGGFVPFTGFRIHREYIIDNLRAPIFHFNSVSHCDHGSVDYERAIEVDRNTDIAFNEPFCLIKPESKTSAKAANKRQIPSAEGSAATAPIRRRGQHYDTSLQEALRGLRNGSMHFSRGKHPRIRQRDLEEDIDVYDYTEIKDVYSIFQESFEDTFNSTDFDARMHLEPKASAHEASFQAATDTLVANSGFISLLMDFAQGIISKIAARSKTEAYIGRKKPSGKEFEIITAKQFEASHFKSEDLVCYNMVKRKKYSKRVMGLFAPHRFIGGLFECAISQEERVQVFETYKTGLQTPPIRCDPENSVPITPLISDDISKQWFQMSSGGQVMQRIPYLYSPIGMDPRFNEQIRGKLDYAHWSDELDVNQEYEFDDDQLNVLTDLVTETSNTISNMVLKMEASLKEKKKGGTRSQISKSLHDLQVRFLSSIGLISEGEALLKLEVIEKSWDDIEV